jgi:hypothetical protein
MLRLKWSVGAVLVAGLFWSACSDQRSDLTSPDQEPAVPEFSVASSQGRQVVAVQQRHTKALMRLPGVVGTAVGLNANGRPVVKILAKEALTHVPKALDGVPVEVIVTGEFFALPQATPQAKPTCGKPNLPPCAPPLNARHPRPVPIGVSTGHPDITAGTLGARVTDGTNVWALSNNHVYADENQAGIGDDLIQPGTFDGGSSPADDIGTLAAFQPIVFGGACVNEIDAAIGATTTALVGNSTPAGVGYGTPRSQTVAPAVNMKVKKVGRTTGFTKGSITAINATVNIGYSSGVACFTGQIIITPGSFSAGGDSGSLIVVDGKGRTKNDDRKPVGLLYAGSATATIANPIGPVLTRFGVTIDGN